MAFAGELELAEMEEEALEMDAEQHVEDEVALTFPPWTVAIPRRALRWRSLEYCCRCASFLSLAIVSSLETAGGGGGDAAARRGAPGH